MQSVLFHFHKWRTLSQSPSLAAVPAFGYQAASSFREKRNNFDSQNRESKHVAGGEVTNRRGMNKRRRRLLDALSYLPHTLRARDSSGGKRHQQQRLLLLLLSLSLFAVFEEVQERWKKTAWEFAHVCGWNFLCGRRRRAADASAPPHSTGFLTHFCSLSESLLANFVINLLQLCISAYNRSISEALVLFRRNMKLFNNFSNFLINNVTVRSREMFSFQRENSLKKLKTAAAAEKERKSMGARENKNAHSATPDAGSVCARYLNEAAQKFTNHQIIC